MQALNGLNSIELDFAILNQIVNLVSIIRITEEFIIHLVVNAFNFCLAIIKYPRKAWMKGKRTNLITRILHDMNAECSEDLIN